MEVGLGEVNLQVAMSKNLSVSKTPILPFFAREKGSFFEGAKVHNFSICQRTLRKIWTCKDNAFPETQRKICMTAVLFVIL